ncbi:MAG: thiamine pyrophosphate-dependent dehydrogenase E1 component subunit alpha [Candidatus Caldarchaeum sp.]
MFQAISPEGVEVSEIKIGRSLLLSMYRDMVMARILDAWLMRLQRMGLVGLYAPSEGQEAAYVGTAYALEDEDWVFPLYRELPTYIARKVPIQEILNRHLQNSGDRLKGRDIAIYGDVRYNIVPAPVPVSLHTSSAVGFALAFRMKGERRVVMNYFGEGATSKGDLHEALNFAGVFKAPIVFVCVNNQYALSLPVTCQTAAPTIADKAVAYGFEGVRVDGNDVVACYLAAEKAVEKARKGLGPALLETVTYRLGPHTTADDPSRYRNEEEVEKWRAKDPIKRLKKFLIDHGMWSGSDDRSLWAEYEETVRKTADECVNVPKLPYTVIFEDVYASELWHLAEERNELLEDLKTI